MNMKHYIKQILLLLLMIGSFIKAQDLEPRSLSPAPVGMNFLVAGYLYSTGNILLDPALPIEGLDAKIHTFVGAYVRTINFFGLPAKVDMIIPYSTGIWNGELNNNDSSVTRNGLGDPSIKLSVNIVGNRDQELSKFTKNQKDFNLGFALRVRVPVGQYDNTKLINLGSNRWSFKASMGMSYNVSKWVFELHLNSWLFTKNNEFYNGNKLEQSPMFSGQAHVIYTFKQGFWGAISYGLVNGGATTLNDIEKDDDLLSERVGAVLTVPLFPMNSLKFVVSSGISARYGAKFTTVGLTYQYSWF
jgi:hypothetical protein